MNFLRHASIQQKQMRIIMGICSLALLLASTGFVTHDWLSRRAETASFLLVHCDVLGRTCWGALDFKDPKAAEENLNALQADPRMISASVFAADGSFFARYHRAGNAAPAPGLFSTNAVSVFAGGRLRAARPILRGNEPLGFIVLESDLEALHGAIKYQVGIAALVVTLATGLAFFLSSRLQRLVSGPIVGLLETTRAVATSRNYALRARKESTDELGQLVDGFNDMLQQVQSRDAELQQAQNFLEKRVADRTEELQLEVAERRRSEQTVLESQQFLQSTLDALSAHIAILDESGVIVSVNAAWNRFARENEHSVTGLGAGGNYLEVCDESRGEFAEEAPAVAHGIRAVLAGELEEFRLEYPCHSPKEKRWFIVRVTRFGGECARRIVIAHENISERKQAEVRLRAALHEVESQQFALNESSIVGITDRKGRLTYVNDKFCAISKFSREELLGQDHRIINSGHHPREFFKTLWATIGRGEVWRGRVCNRAKDGSLYWVDTTIVPFKDESGAITQHVVIRSDVTDRVQAEDELARAHKNLVDVSRQAGMAEVAMGVLHNVGNVLNSVNVSANLVSDQVRKAPVADLGRVVALLREQGAGLGAFFTNDPRGAKVPNFLAQVADKFTRQQEAQLHEIAALQKNIEHIKDIVAMQQSYARVSGVTENLSPAELIENALRMNIGAFQKHEVELVREVAADLPFVCVDKHKVMQILVNLLRNAKHACDDAGRPDKRITVRAINENERIRITIADNGVGIPPANLKRIFNHGFTTKKNGHGFGLHSAANAAKEMGGSISVHSSGEGHGAMFTLELPAVAQQGPRLPGPHLTNDRTGLNPEAPDSKATFDA